MSVTSSSLRMRFGWRSAHWQKRWRVWIARLNPADFLHRYNHTAVKTEPLLKHKPTDRVDGEKMVQFPFSVGEDFSLWLPQTHTGVFALSVPALLEIDKDNGNSKWEGRVIPMLYSRLFPHLWMHCFTANYNHKKPLIPHSVKLIELRKKM